MPHLLDIWQSLLLPENNAPRRTWRSRWDELRTFGIQGQAKDTSAEKNCWHFLFQKIIRGPLQRLRHPVYPFWYTLGQSSQDAILALGSQMDPAQDGELEVLEGSG